MSGLKGTEGILGYLEESPATHFRLLFTCHSYSSLQPQFPYHIETGRLNGAPLKGWWSFQLHGLAQAVSRDRSQGFRPATREVLQEMMGNLQALS